MPSYWIVERTANPRFPYRISIEQDGVTRLALRVQEKWPGPGGQIFCLREQELDPAERLEPEERAPIVTLTRRGRKLSLALDRPRRRRCEFLFLKKSYRSREGEYEQIFFRTQSAVRQHRSRSRPSLYGTGSIHVLIDSAERYPWKFGAASVERKELPVGDYALLHDHALAAVVERKSFDNLLGDIASIQVLHQQLAELEAYPHAAVVVEAQYADFLDRSRIGKWSAARVNRMLGELAACHPKLPLVYAGNRKMANQWAQQFFLSVSAKLADPAPRAVARVLAHDTSPAPDGGLDFEVRRCVLEELPDRFAIGQVRERFPQLGDQRLRKVLNGLRGEGLIECRGRGSGARWVRLGG